jgi:hypothetical protein
MMSTFIFICKHTTNANMEGVDGIIWAGFRCIVRCNNMVWYGMVWCGILTRSAVKKHIRQIIHSFTFQHSSVGGTSSVLNNK